MNLLAITNDTYVVEFTLRTISYLVRDPVILREQFCAVHTGDIRRTPCERGIALLVGHFTRGNTDIAALAALGELIEHNDHEITQLVINSGLLVVAEMRCVRPACVDDDGSVSPLEVAAGSCVTTALARQCAYTLNRLAAGKIHLSSTLTRQLWVWYEEDEVWSEVRKQAAATMGSLRLPDLQTLKAQLQLAYKTNAKLISKIRDEDATLSHESTRTSNEAVHTFTESFHRQVERLNEYTEAELDSQRRNMLNELCSSCIGSASVLPERSFFHWTCLLLMLGNSVLQYGLAWLTVPCLSGWLSPWGLLWLTWNQRRLVGEWEPLIWWSSTWLFHLNLVMIWYSVQVLDNQQGRYIFGKFLHICITSMCVLFVFGTLAEAKVLQVVRPYEVCAADLIHPFSTSQIDVSPTSTCAAPGRHGESRLRVVLLHGGTRIRCS